MNAETINAKVDTTIDWMDASYAFKKDKLDNKRPTVKGKIPVPSVEGLVAILESGDKKQWELVQEALYDTVRSAISEEVGNNENLKDLSELDMSKYTWAAIANMPKEDRRSAIPEEMWKGFAEDYIKVMQPLTGKSMEAVTNVTVIFLKKFAPWKSGKKIIELLKQQLAIYSAQPSAEQYGDVLTFLVKRADTYLAANDLTLVASNL